MPWWEWATSEEDRQWQAEQLRRQAAERVAQAKAEEERKRRTEEALATKRAVERQLLPPTQPEKGSLEWRRQQNMVPSVPEVGLKPSETWAPPPAPGEPTLGSWLLESAVPKPALAQIERIPYAGPPLRRGVESVTSPLGIATTAVWPGLTAQMLAGQVLAGTAAQALPIPPAAKTGIETAGAFAGPLAAQRAGAAIRGVTRATEEAFAPGVTEVLRGAPAAEGFGATELTSEGREFLTRIDAGKLPPYVTNEMFAITRANGFDIGAEASVADVIEALRAKAAGELTPQKAKSLGVFIRREVPKPEAPPLTPAAGEARIDEALRAFEAEHRPQWEAERQAAETAAQQREQAELQDFVDRLFAGGRKTSKPRGKVSTPAAGEGAVPPGAPPSGAVPPSAGEELHRLATPERPTVETPPEAHPVDPTGPPPSGPPTSIGDSLTPEPSTPGGLLARFLDRMPGREQGVSDWAKFEGGLGAEGKDIELWVKKTQNLERSLGIKPGSDRTPEKEAIIKALHGEGAVDPKYQPLVDELRSFLAAHEQRTLADVPAFEKKMLPQYWPRGWRNPEIFTGAEPAGKPVVRTGKLGPGQVPGTLRGRTLPKTFTEAVEFGGEPISWDPAQQIGLHAAELADYRYSQVVGELWKMEERAIPRSAAPRAWIVPDYPAFQSRPYVTPEGKIGWSEPLTVSPEDHQLLENMLGKRPPGVEDAAAYVSSVFKRVKVMGGFFQYFDLQNRALWRSATRGELGALPAAMRAWAGTFIPPLRKRLWEATMADPAVREGVEEGLQLVGGLDTWKRTMRASLEPDLVLKFPVLGEVPTGKLPVGVKQGVRTIQRGLNNIEGYLAGGLYDSAHPQFTSAFYKSVRSELAAKYPEYTSRQLSALAADHTNVLMSAIPDWESALNPRLRQLGRAVAFSVNENEAWLRQITRTVTSENRALYLRQWSGYIFGTLAAAELINYGMTGHFLGQEQLSPIVMRNGKPTYNTRFARPQLDGQGPLGKVVGLTGPMGRHIYLDMMGQADTPFRLFAPEFYVMSRLSTPLSVAVQELQSRTFFGSQPIKTTGQRLGFAAEQGLMPIPAVGFGEERSRIGTAGAGIQAAGWNVSAEGLYALLQRKFEEKTGKKWDSVGPNERQLTIMDDPELSRIQRESQKIGLAKEAPTAVASQAYRDARDTWQTQIKQAIQNPRATGADISSLLSDASSDLASKGDILFAGTKERKPEGRLAQGLAEYYAVEMAIVGGLPDYDTFYNNQDAILDKYADVNLAAEVRNGIAKRWPDLQVRETALRVFDAKAVRKQYYAIPAKLGMSVEAQTEGQRVAAQAQDAAAYSPLTGKQILKRWLAQGKITMRELVRALTYLKAPDNPRRERFRMQHAAELSWFEAIPLEEQPVEPELEAAAAR